METIGGPFFDDLKVGDRFADAPSVSLTDGLAAAHQAILGDRLRLALDRQLSARIAGVAIVHPGLVWDLAIGQSTLATQRVIANLFYRGLAFRRFPAIGDSLRTVTEVASLRPLAAKTGRPPRGLAVLHIVTVDQQDRSVLDFHRCAMLPARNVLEPAGSGAPKRKEDDLDPASLLAGFANWDLAAYRSSVPGPHFADVRAGAVLAIEGGDLVSGAPELARLTLNLAMVHHDRMATGAGRRLVYGGHAIGIAAAQITRAFPSLVTIVGWHGCDHTGPVFEGDILRSEITVERCDPILAGGGLLHLRVLVRATRLDDTIAEVLDWRLVGLLA